MLWSWRFSWVRLGESVERPECDVEPGLNLSAGYPRQRRRATRRGLRCSPSRGHAGGGVPPLLADRVRPEGRGPYGELPLEVHIEALLPLGPLPFSREELEFPSSHPFKCSALPTQGAFHLLDAKPERLPSLELGTSKQRRAPAG